MSETPVAFAKRRVAELQPLIDQCRPGTRLRVEHFPATSVDLEKIGASVNPGRIEQMKEQLGANKTEGILKAEALLQELHPRGAFDTERLSKIMELSKLLEERGYQVMLEDFDPMHPLECSEIDLQALNFERVAVPTEGCFLAICFEAEA